MTTGNPYSQLPDGAELVNGQLEDIDGEPWIVDEVCNCDIDYRCHAIDCQERYFADRDYYAGVYANQPKTPSRTEWNECYSDHPAKRDSYDLLFGRGLV